MEIREIIGQNIARYRKERDLTQEDLAIELGISFKAISKWERGNSLPDITLVPDISKILGISIDRLFGYKNQENITSIYEQKYQTENYYWGLIPSKMCFNILELMPPIRQLKVLDIGCGEGKDAVFFARNGYDVSAFDISTVGLEKLQKLCEEINTSVNTFRADINDYRIKSKYDILFSSGVLHYIKPELRREIFLNYKENTNEDGIHVFNVFVDKPFIEAPPENEPNAYPWISGELLTYYHDWEILKFEEQTFDCESSGIPHKHTMNIMIAKKR
ncbi:helix-turn-helix domain-containing protein [Tissierella sp. MB52-C2]|uniref:helix-turn-helix domain-containing protein n=1 Tax=Tissierella sp. MB52-C2 TaxID=3070999 RepID=UPI00280A8413|nr:helix-turn-helix domain-containing protein [Tissierella sp. MB52-C2]WMM24991.1 helix-turn-helix domain-containing protein [Tissierella sp. MB52-C2]